MFLRIRDENDGSSIFKEIGCFPFLHNKGTLPLGLGYSQVTLEIL